MKKPIFICEKEKMRVVWSLKEAQREIEPRKESVGTRLSKLIYVKRERDPQ